jgi:tRNA(Arg) A34 adenosine deaminase TadA
VNLHNLCEISLPGWLLPFVEGWQAPLETLEQRMDLAIALSAENVRHETGGPFGALVIDEGSGVLLGVGVNLVTRLDLSLGHAEMVAVSLAQCAAGTWNLGAGRRSQLVTSCEPCAMCFGAVPWSGVSRLVWGATREDAEAAGFDEGDKPDGWVETLERRGIQTAGEVRRAQAAAVLKKYARSSGAIYHPACHDEGLQN